MTTLYNAQVFEETAPPWFDGFFNWEWLLPVFKGTKITPMDFDATVERKLHYLIIETKRPNIIIPQGQLRTLERLNQAKSFTILKLWGKDTPQKWEGQLRYRSGKCCQVKTGYGPESIYEFCKNWFAWANR